MSWTTEWVLLLGRLDVVVCLTALWLTWVYLLGRPMRWLQYRVRTALPWSFLVIGSRLGRLLLLRSFVNRLWCLVLAGVGTVGRV